MPPKIVKTKKKFYKSQFPIEFDKAIGGKLKKFFTSPSAKNVRVRSLRLAGERWGSGLDEHYQTRMLTLNFQKFSKIIFTDLFIERSRTSHLIWKTPRGLGGHPGALKNHQGASNTGMISAEHGTRDKLRELSISVEGNDGKMAQIKSGLATIKYMMSPKEELLRSVPSLKKQKTGVFSVNETIGDLRNPAELEKQANIVQTLRESLKWETAAKMYKNNIALELIPNIYTTYLKANDTAEKAMNDFYNTNNGNFNDAKTSQTDNLNEPLKKMKLKRKRGLSPPRKLASH